MVFGTKGHEIRDLDVSTYYDTAALPTSRLGNVRTPSKVLASAAQTEIVALVSKFYQVKPFQADHIAPSKCHDCFLTYSEMRRLGPSVDTWTEWIFIYQHYTGDELSPFLARRTHNISLLAGRESLSTLFNSSSLRAPRRSRSSSCYGYLQDNGRLNM